MKEMDKHWSKYDIATYSIYENKSWIVSLHTSQKTPFTMLLTCKEGIHCHRDLSTEGTLLFFEAIKFIENLAYDKLGAVKINYMALMMIDPLLHYHVFPRYDKQLKVFGRQFTDKYYPGLVDMLDIESYKVEEIYIHYKNL